MHLVGEGDLQFALVEERALDGVERDADAGLGQLGRGKPRDRLLRFEVQCHRSALLSGFYPLTDAEHVSSLPSQLTATPSPSRALSVAGDERKPMVVASRRIPAR